MPESKRSKSGSNTTTTTISSNCTDLRCQHCAGPLSREMIGSAVGGISSASYGFNQGATCDCIVFSLYWTGRWSGSCSSTTCLLILSCNIVISFLNFAAFTG